jgi:hypothetical protein
MFYLSISLLNILNPSVFRCSTCPLILAFCPLLTRAQLLYNVPDAPHPACILLLALIPPQDTFTHPTLLRHYPANPGQLTPFPRKHSADASPGKRRHTLHFTSNPLERIIPLDHLHLHTFTQTSPPDGSRSTDRGALPEADRGGTARSFAQKII